MPRFVTSRSDLKVFGGKIDDIYAAPFVVASDDPKAKAFVAKARAKSGPDMAISNYVMMHRRCAPLAKSPRSPGASRKLWHASLTRRRLTRSLNQNYKFPLWMVVDMAISICETNQRFLEIGARS